MTWTGGLKKLDGSDELSFPTNPWDTAKFGGVQCPGVVRVRARAPDGLDRKKPKGQKKATTTDNGDPQVEFDIEVELQPAEIIPFANNILPILKPRSKNGGREQLKFVHPQAQLHGVDAIIIGPIDTPSPKPGGTMTIKIKAFEWTANPAPVKKPSGKAQDKPQRPGSAVRRGTTVLINPHTNQPRVPTAEGQFPS